jgi:hypothetical protein
VEFFFKLNALKMSEITVFDLIDEEVAVLPSFFKVLLLILGFTTVVETKNE